MPWAAAPCIWPCTIIGFTERPESSTTVHATIVTAPVSGSTSSSQISHPFANANARFSCIVAAASVVSRVPGRLPAAAARATSKIPIDRSVPTTVNAPSRYSTSAGRGLEDLRRHACTGGDDQVRGFDGRAAAPDHRAGGERADAVRHPIGVALDDAHRFEGHAEAFGDDLAKTVSCPWPCDWLPIGTSTTPVGSTRTSAYSRGTPPVPSRYGPRPIPRSLPRRAASSRRSGKRATSASSSASSRRAT
jgi:hypothetical protein